MSFSSGKLSNNLKMGKIVLVHKQVQLNFVDNYRPISILSVHSKLFERYMANRLVKFLKSRNITNVN